MKVQSNHVAKPLQKLRKQLKDFPSSPLPRDVHSLRTRSRRLEATLAALALHREKTPRRLLTLITPVRKAAGRVRDMDVLIGLTLTLSEDQGSEAVVRLVEHLAKMRVRHARKLKKVVNGRRQELRRRLKQSAKLLRSKLKGSSAGLDGETVPRILITELSHWPDLDEGNLHMFRIRIKELRYMLQLTPQADRTQVDLLAEVKDKIGHWHDWVVLLKIAGKVLDPRREREVLRDIERITEEKLQAALSAAQRVRQRYFAVPDGRKAGQAVLQMAS